MRKRLRIKDDDDDTVEQKIKHKLLTTEEKEFMIWYPA